jgi:hypothetical protein
MKLETMCGRLLAIPWLLVVALVVPLLFSGCKAEEGYVRVAAIKPSIEALAPWTEKGLAAAVDSGELTEAQASNYGLELKTLLGVLDEASARPAEGESDQQAGSAPARVEVAAMAVAQPRWSVRGRGSEY